MKKTRVFHWVLAAGLAAFLPVTTHVASGHQMGGFAGGGFHGSPGVGTGHPFGSRPVFHNNRFVGHGVHNHFFPNHRRFFAFGFPYWWYPDFYYGYPYGYADYDASPVYDYRYWAGLATAVQAELARRGYYHGSIDGAIGPNSRDAIRAFQKSNNLPVTGLIDPPLLKALKLPAVPRVTASY